MFSLEAYNIDGDVSAVDRVFLENVYLYILTVVLSFTLTCRNNIEGERQPLPVLSTSVLEATDSECLGNS